MEEFCHFGSVLAAAVVAVAELKQQPIFSGGEWRCGSIGGGGGEEIMVERLH